MEGKPSSASGEQEVVDRAGMRAVCSTQSGLGLLGMSPAPRLWGEGDRSPVTLGCEQLSWPRDDQQRARVCVQRAECPVLWSYFQL